MPNRLFQIILISCVIILPALLHAFEGKVVSISDGDTIKFLKNGEQVKIRLAAIDCPAKGQPYSQKAKQFTADMVAGKVVKVWETDIDRYGRIVAFVFVDDKNLNKELFSAGLAWHYKKYSRDRHWLRSNLRQDPQNVDCGLSRVLCRHGSGGGRNDK
jgi:endonuclease YncB( thermonuclease family)